MANVQQADYRIPTSLATVQPHQPASASGNPLGLSWPLVRHADQTNLKDVPNGYQTPSGK